MNFRIFFVLVRYFGLLLILRNSSCWGQTATVPVLLNQDQSGMYSHNKHWHLELQSAESIKGWEEIPTYGNFVGEFAKILISNNFLFVASRVNGIYAISKDSHKIAWNFPVEGGVNTRPIHFRGSLIFAGENNTFYSLESFSGKVQWQIKHGFSMSSEAVIVGSTAYFINTQNSLTGIDLKTGEVKYSYRNPESPKISVLGSAQPLYDEGYFYAAFSDGTFIKIKEGATQPTFSKKLSIYSDRFKDVDSNPLLDGAFIYLSSVEGKLACLKKSDLSIVWEKQGGSAYPVAKYQDTIFQSSHNELRGFDTVTGAQKVSIPFANAILGAVQVLENKLLVSTTNNSVYLVDPISGSIDDEFEIGTGTFAGANFDDNLIYLLSNNSTLYRFVLRAPKT